MHGSHRQGRLPCTASGAHAAAGRQPPWRGVGGWRRGNRRRGWRPRTVAGACAAGGGNPRRRTWGGGCVAAASGVGPRARREAPAPPSGASLVGGGGGARCPTAAGGGCAHAPRRAPKLPVAEWGSVPTMGEGAALAPGGTPWPPRGTGRVALLGENGGLAAADQAAEGRVERQRRQ